MGTGDIVVIEAALNGGRDRAEHPAVPLSPEDVAAEARRCADAGATVFHVHARSADGASSVDPGWYEGAIRRIAAAVPDAGVSVTSIRPVGVPVAAVTGMLDRLAALGARPDLISVNLGHITIWEANPDGSGIRRTAHFPNDYDEIVSILAACRRHGVAPELGLMDLGFVSNAVALRDDGVLDGWRWFLVELDSPAYGAGPQVAPSTIAAYEALVAPLRERIPDAVWAAHGADEPGFEVIERAIADGAHVRVGFEDSVRLPGGALPTSNADLVAWAVATARALGREPASVAEAASIVGFGR